MIKLKDILNEGQTNRSLQNDYKGVVKTISNFIKSNGYTVNPTEFSKITKNAPSKPIYGFSRELRIPVIKKNGTEEVDVIIQISGLGKKFDVNVYFKLR